MQVAKLFKNGNSQAVRLPKEFRFSGEQVYIKKVSGGVLLLPHEESWQSMFDALDEWFHEENYLSCMFIRASCEYPQSSNPIHKISEKHIFYFIFYTFDFT